MPHYDYLGVQLGREPSPRDRRTLQAANYFKRTLLPTPPAEVRWDKPVPSSEWGVDGNNRYGNCVICTAEHMIESATYSASQKSAGISENAVIDLSRVMGALRGYNIRDRLVWWRNKGMWNYQLWAFAAVDLMDHETIKHCINMFGSVDIGVNLPTGWQSADVWDTNAGRPGSWGGHSVPLVGYDSQYLYLVTWGDIQRMTWAGMDYYCDEAYFCILPEFFAPDGLTPSGFDLVQLHHDLFQIDPKAVPFDQVPRRSVCSPDYSSVS